MVSTNLVPSHASLLPLTAGVPPFKGLHAEEALYRYSGIPFIWGNTVYNLQLVVRYIDLQLAI